MTPSDDLVRKLEDLDLTNVALARLAGVAPSSVQRWTAGTIDPPVMLMRLLECMILLRRNSTACDEMLERWTVPVMEVSDETLPRS